MTATASSIVALPAIADLDAIDGLRDRLLDAVEAGSVQVNAAAVERVAANTLFMLLSAAETARRNDFSFALTEASAPLLAAIERLGLRGHFSLLLRG